MGTASNKIGSLPLIQRRRTVTHGSRLDSDPFFVEAVQYKDLYSMDQSNKYKVRIFPQIDRGFFLSDNDWTCYRRNYFQVSSTFSLIGMSAPVTDPECPCLVVDGDQSVRTVVRFLVGISAQISGSDKKIELVQHTPKRDKGPQTTPHAQPVRASGSMHATAIGINSNTACFERLQFKTATANNGKRRAAQQYYVLVVELFGECEDGSRVLIAASASSPIVVRGRSPGHYADGSNRRNTSGHSTKITPSYSATTFDRYALSSHAALRSASNMLPSVTSSFSSSADYAFQPDPSSLAGHPSYQHQLAQQHQHQHHQPPPPPQNAFGITPFGLQNMVPQQRPYQT
ncbi:hypothetical protein EC988_005253, partial [Linderina pennispora]